MLHRAQIVQKLLDYKRKLRMFHKIFWLDEVIIHALCIAGRKKESKNFGKRGFNCRRAEWDQVMLTSLNNCCWRLMIASIDARWAKKGEFLQKLRGQTRYWHAKMWSHNLQLIKAAISHIYTILRVCSRQSTVRLAKFSCVALLRFPIVSKNFRNFV